MYYYPGKKGQLRSLENVSENKEVYASDKSKEESQVRERYVEVSNCMQNYISNVSSVWQGNDATSYVNKFRNEAIPELQKYVKIMRDYQKFLSEVYPIYKSLDEYYDKPINT